MVSGLRQLKILRPAIPGRMGYVAAHHVATNHRRERLLSCPAIHERPSCIATLISVRQIQPTPGVYIAMNGRIWDPATVRKNVAANRFEAVP